MAQRSGFFTAKLVEGNYDRKYKAEDYSENLAFIIGDGVLRSRSDDLKPKANGMGVEIGIGRAWIRGHWFVSDTVYSLAVPTAPTTNPRIDRVMLRLDNTIAGRNINFYYAQGTPAASPVPPEPMNTDTVRDLVLCNVLVPVNATSVTVTDTRADADICGWAFSVFGGDDFFKSLDGEFDDWFQLKKDKLASVTVFKQHTWRGITTAANTKVVTFNIPQYDPTGVDVIQVFTNGILEVEGVDYTLDGQNITFLSENGKTAGQEIIVNCWKSYDGTGLGSVVDQVEELQNRVDALANFTEYNYICTGNADNVALSKIAQDFLAGSDSDNKKLAIRVYGTIGVSAPNKGEGTAADPYQWFSFGTEVSTSRKVVFDFENCSRINIEAPANSYNVIFYGHNVFVKNANVRAVHDAATTAGSLIGNNSRSGKVQFDNCAFVIDGQVNCWVGSTGTWNDCYFNVTTRAGHGFCLQGYTESFIRVKGGEFYAYAPSGSVAACIFIGGAATDCVCITDAINCPIYSRTGLLQTYAVRDLSKNGKSVYNTTVTPLTMMADAQAILNTIAVNKFNRT